MLDEKGREILTYDELTKEQQEFFLKNIWNGVGSREYIDIPDFIFKIPSIYHDWWYWLGGSKQDRKKADKDFFHRCHHEVRKRPVWKRPFYYVMSYIYFYGLKKLGGKAWEYYPAPARNWDEFMEHVNAYYKRVGKPFNPK